MKKLLLTGLVGLLLAVSAFASEMTEDYLDIAKNYAVMGDYSGAITYVDKALALEPDNKSFRDIRSMLIRLLNVNRKSYITSTNPKLNAVIEARKKGDRQGMLDALNLAAAGGNFWVYTFLGDYYRENRLFDQAVDAYSRAFEAQPGFTRALLSIAQCYLEAGNYDAVIPPITRFLYYNQQEDFGYFIRAKAYMGMSQYNDAETEINTAIALNDDIEYEYVHGIILYNKGNYAKAKTLLEGLTEDIQTSDIYKYIGLCYYGLKDYNNALINLDKALILSDDDKFLLLKYNEVKSAMNGPKAEQSELKE